MNASQTRTESAPSFRISPGVILASAIVLLIGWSVAHKLLREHQQRASFDAEDAAARIGDPVLSVPKDLVAAPLGDSWPNDKCSHGFDDAKYSMCFGQGMLFGLPAELTVEWTEKHELHYLAYDFQLPSAKVLIPRLTELYGPPHRYDALPVSGYAIGLCWVLPHNQSITMEKGTDDKDSGLSVTIQSQVAANLIRVMMAVPKPCLAQPLVAPNAFDTNE